MSNLSLIPQARSNASVLLAQDALLARRLVGAERRLAELDTPYARVVLSELASGRVAVRGFHQLPLEEFRQLLRFAPDAPRSEASIRQLHLALARGELRSLHAISRRFLGYQWENRLYVSPHQCEEELVATLAHETMHYLRGAHLADFTRIEVLAREEIAAYEAEVRVHRPRVTRAELEAIRSGVERMITLGCLRAFER